MSAVNMDPFEADLPELNALLLRPTTQTARTLVIPPNGPSLRRSPRKHSQKDGSQKKANALAETPILCASSQQRPSPQKNLPTRRTAPSKRAQTKTRDAALSVIPELAPLPSKKALQNKSKQLLVSEDYDSLDELLQPMSKLNLQKNKQADSGSDKENTSRMTKGSRGNPTSTMSRITREARAQTTRSTTGGKKVTRRTNPYISTQAHCEDLNESSGTEGEDEDTDLSGFIVDDDEEISFAGSAIEISSDSEQEVRPRKSKQKPSQPPKTRRLVRGRRHQISDSDDDDDNNDDGQDKLSKALDGMNLGDATLKEHKDANRRKQLEIIDLTSSPVQNQDTASDTRTSPEPSMADPFLMSNSNVPKLMPSSKTAPVLLPSKSGPLPASPKRPAQSKETPKTPPATPPRSPTKLKSPSKLLSPVKRPEAPKSPHRQSMAGFWDADIVNEWHDTFSPKKAPTLSPRKNPLAKFNLNLDDAFSSDTDSKPSTRENSQDPFEDSDSLPSPCESPKKSRSPSKVSALKAEQTRIREEKKAKAAAKADFDAEKEQMALDLLKALDKHVTDSKISKMSASTGGIQVVWSKTLRSTAGRANWRRTVQKPSGSPVKDSAKSMTNPDQQAIIVKHFASIELAEKIIDRPERLVNTLAHEFCHLANFMVSNIRDQPHGESFKRWGRQVTSWLKSSAAKPASGYRSEWGLAEVTTKHSYVVETKYLWVCAGRPASAQKQSLAMKMLAIENEDQESCGAEYGRHSKSIDVEKQRCGRCKGYLVQVRPKPRATSSPKKKTISQSCSDVDKLESSLESVSLDD